MPPRTAQPITATMIPTIGTAYHFDGSAGGINGVINVGNSPFGTLVNNITVTAWINPDSLGGIRRIWGVNGPGGGAPENLYSVKQFTYLR